MSVRVGSIGFRLVGILSLVMVMLHLLLLGRVNSRVSPQQRQGLVARNQVSFDPNCREHVGVRLERDEVNGYLKKSIFLLFEHRLNVIEGYD